MPDLIKKCDNGYCGQAAEFSSNCGAYVCFECDTHVGLARCYCGWSRHGEDGRKELLEMGETLESEYDIGMGQGGDAYNDFMFGESPDF